MPNVPVIPQFGNVPVMYRIILYRNMPALYSCQKRHGVEFNNSDRACGIHPTNAGSLVGDAKVSCTNPFLAQVVQ
jgi:hypothetical protein